MEDIDKKLILNDVEDKQTITKGRNSIMNKLDDVEKYAWLHEVYCVCGKTHQVKNLLSGFDSVKFECGCGYGFKIHRSPQKIDIFYAKSRKGFYVSYLRGLPEDDTFYIFKGISKLLNIHNKVPKRHIKVQATFSPDLVVFNVRPRKRGRDLYKLNKSKRRIAKRVGPIKATNTVLIYAGMSRTCPTYITHLK